MNGAKARSAYACQSVRTPPTPAARRQRKEAELNAVNNGVAVVPEWPERPQISGRSRRRFPRRNRAHEEAEDPGRILDRLDYFVESCHKLNLEEIDRKDLLKFSAFLRDEKDQAPRSVYNKFENVMTFLKANGIRGLAARTTGRGSQKKNRRSTSRKNWTSCSQSAMRRNGSGIEFFLMTGMREQEVMYTYWSDVNFAASTVRVSHKPDRGWTPKAYKEREIPIPTKLVKSLKAWKAKADKTCSLVFPTAGCNPKLDFLDGLKAVAERAKLDKDDFWLHKFRATFATWSLWAGVDLRTVQQWLGHSDMESTMRYLKPSRSQHVRDKVNEIFA